MIIDNIKLHLKSVGLLPPVDLHYCDPTQGETNRLVYPLNSKAEAMIGIIRLIDT